MQRRNSNHDLVGTPSLHRAHMREIERAEREEGYILMDPLIGGQKRSEGDEKSGGGQHLEARLRADPKNVILPPTQSTSHMCE